MRVYRYTPSDSVSDSSELTIGCFLLILLRVVLGPTMFAVTSGYSVSEKVRLVRERRLLAERKIDVDDKRLNTDYLLTCKLQRHSKRTAVMSHSQQHSGVFDEHSSSLSSNLLDPSEGDRRDHLRVSEDENFSASF